MEKRYMTINEMVERMPSDIAFIASIGYEAGDVSDLEDTIRIAFKCDPTLGCEIEDESLDLYADILRVRMASTWKHEFKEV